MILEEGWDLYVPISTVEENLRRTEGVGAVTRQRFLFRDDFLGGESSGIQEFSLEEKLSEFSAREFTHIPLHLALQEILFGANEKGVFSRCLNFMQKKHSEGLCAAQTVQRFSRYVELFRRRCRSELPTPAAWLRRRLAAHQAYAGGSLVPREFVKDMAMLAASLSQRPRPCVYRHDVLDAAKPPHSGSVSSKAPAAWSAARARSSQVEQSVGDGQKTTATATKASPSGGGPQIPFIFGECQFQPRQRTSKTQAQYVLSTGQERCADPVRDSLHENGVAFSPELEREVRRTFPSPTSSSRGARSRAAAPAPDRWDRAGGRTESGAQVGRYGGNDAVSFEDGKAFTDPAADTASTFLGQAPRHVHSNKNLLPGQRPWSAFKRGTQIIVLLWAASVVWAIARAVLNVYDAYVEHKHTQTTAQQERFWMGSLCEGIDEELRSKQILQWMDRRGRQGRVLDHGCGWQRAQQVALQCDERATCMAAILAPGGRSVRTPTATRGESDRHVAMGARQLRRGLSWIVFFALRDAFVPRGSPRPLRPLRTSQHAALWDWAVDERNAGEDVLLPNEPVNVPLNTSALSNQLQDVIFTVNQKGWPQVEPSADGWIVGDAPDELEPKKELSKEEEKQGDRELAGGLIQFFYEFKNAVNLCVLFRSRALATDAKVTWGDYGKARVIGFPPARSQAVALAKLLRNRPYVVAVAPKARQLRALQDAFGSKKELSEAKDVKMMLILLNARVRCRSEDCKDIRKDVAFASNPVFHVSFVGKGEAEAMLYKSINTPWVLVRRLPGLTIRALALHLPGGTPPRVFARTKQDALLMLEPRGRRLQPLVEVEPPQNGSHPPETLLVLNGLLFSDQAAEGGGLTAYLLQTGVKFHWPRQEGALKNLTSGAFCRQLT
eukprot:g23413.t1